MNIQIRNLSGGEISPRFWDRTDLPFYQASSAKLENFFSRRYGVDRRPGLEHIDTFGGDFVKMHDFRFSSDTVFALAFGNQAMRFYSNGQLVMDGGDPYEVETPWTDEDVSQLRFCNVLDTVFITHPNYFPRSLFRIADDNWTLSTLKPLYPPLLTENLNTTRTLTPSATTGESIDIEASWDVFSESHVGSYWKIGHNRIGNDVSFDITGTGQSSAILVDGDFSVTTVGEWVASVAVEWSMDQNTWEVLSDWTGANDRQVAWVGTNDYPIWLRVSCTSFSSGTNARIILDAASPYVYGLVQITEVTDAKNAVANVIRDLYAAEATPYWTEGAWSDFQGYPRIVKWFYGRLWFFSNFGQPLGIWWSRFDAFNDFERSASDASSGGYDRIASSTGDSISWVSIRKNAIVIGTSADEWFIVNAATSSAEVQKASSYGSADVPAVELNDSLIFAQGGGQLVRDYIGIDTDIALQRDPNLAAELTFAAEHMCMGGITEIAVIQHPIPMVVFVVGGKIVACTYDRTNRELGWHRHPTDGTVYSVCVIPGPNGDEAWFSVSRDGTTRIERFHPTTINNAFAGKPEQCMCLDAGILVYDSVATDFVTGLEHLEGFAVDAMVDGWCYSGLEVQDGTVTLPKSGNWKAVGVPYISELETLPLAFVSQYGDSRYLLSNASLLTVAVHKTSELEFADARVGEWYSLQRREDGDDPTIPYPPQTGPIKVPVAGGFSRETRIRIRQSKPLPATILGISVGYNSSEK